MENISIKVEYQLNGDLNFKTFYLKPEEYFDPIKEDNNTIFDLIEIHSLEPRKYIREEMDKIKFLNFFVEDNAGNKMTTRHTYWENGLNQIKAYCEYKHATLLHTTIIQSIALDDEKYLILRLEEKDGQLLPVTNSIYYNNDEIFKKYELKEFRDNSTRK